MNCRSGIAYRRSSFAVLASSAAIAALVLTEMRPAAQVPMSPDIRQSLVQRLGFTDRHLAAAAAGTPVAIVLPSKADREIAVAGIVLVRSTADRLVAVLKDVERLESGDGFLATKVISQPPRLSDFASLRLPPGDIASLRNCRPGRCDVKLGQGAFDVLKQIDWSAPDASAKVTALARQSSLEYVLAYQKGGNRELAVYRDSARPMFIAQEFEEMIDRVDLWPEALSPLAAYLRGYPSATRPERTTDFFYWSLAEFGLKPIVRLNHVVVTSPGLASGPAHVVAVKQLYASHYFHTALEIRAVVADPALGTTGVYLVVLNTARSDGLTGLFGGLVKSKATSGSRDGLQKALSAIKGMAEGSR